MRLFSYIVVYDTGFSPNPFFGYCTLACCKPNIRRSAQPGDWIIGISPKNDGNRLVYAMKINEKLTFDEYWRDARFEGKKPDFRSGREVDRPGDNIYEPLANGDFRQLPSFHSSGRKEDPANKKHDLGGRYVLIAEDFYYFGSEAKPLPDELSGLIVGRAHKCNFPEELVTGFLEWVGQFPMGVSARPAMWRESDDSWMPSGRCSA